MVGTTLGDVIHSDLEFGNRPIGINRVRVVDESVNGVGFCGGCHKLTTAQRRYLYEGRFLIGCRLLSCCCLSGVYLDRECHQIIGDSRWLWPVE